jgi:glycosyltransferase involved in cell wall biosynthesis
LSHTTFSGIDVYGKSLPFQTISFMMDFQFMHIPELWSIESLNYERNRFIARAKYSDKILLSSNDALNDMKNLVPDYIHKAKVIHFVSQPNKQIHEMTEGEHTQIIENKYEFNGKYFYLPNQFWTHKNHKVVFKAVNLLKKRGKAILVICTGLMDGADSPNRGFEGYISGLKQYIIDNQLGNNIKLLGLIDYKDVQYFMRNSISVINPSLFEGWSSTVEECKSIGKNVILSNLDVHFEQDPAGAIFFDPNNPEELAKVLENKWNNSEGGPDYALEEKAQASLRSRTIKYGKKYQKMILNLVSEI